MLRGGKYVYYLFSCICFLLYSFAFEKFFNAKNYVVSSKICLTYKLMYMKTKKTNLNA